MSGESVSIESYNQLYRNYSKAIEDAENLRQEHIKLKDELRTAKKHLESLLEEYNKDNEERITLKDQFAKAVEQRDTYERIISNALAKEIKPLMEKEYAEKKTCDNCKHLKTFSTAFPVKENCLIHPDIETCFYKVACDTFEPKEAV